MNVLHFSGATSWRGGEQQVAFLVEGLKQISSLSQIVYCPKNSPLAFFCEKNNIKTITYTKRFSLNPLVATKLISICKKNKITHIHLHDAHAHGFAYLASLLGLKVNMILSRRVDFPLKNKISTQKKYHHPNIKSILCVSEQVKKTLLENYRFPQRVKVVYSGVDIDFEYKNKNILRQEYGIPKEKPIIAHVAALTQEKGHLTFVAAAKNILDKGIDAVFFIIGKKEAAYPNIIAHIEALGLKEKFIFTDFRKDLNEIIPEIDCLVFPSKKEGLGTTLIQFAAAGVPIVSTYTGGIPEVILHNKTGLLAPVDDSRQLAQHTLKILDEEALRKRLTTAGKIHIQKFSKTKMFNNTYLSYQEIVS